MGFQSKIKTLQQKVLFLLQVVLVKIPVLDSAYIPLCDI